MTKKEQLKVLNDKINAKRANFNLNRQTAKISALATGDLDKYEYLTGEETNYRSTPVEQNRFEYSPVGKVFNTGLENKEYGADDGILKRLDKIGTANKKLLKLFGGDDKGDDDDDDDEGDDDKGDDDKGDDSIRKSKAKKTNDNSKNYDLKYDQNNNFDKYVKYFNKVSSRESKNDVLNNMLNHLNKFDKELKPKSKENKLYKVAVSNNARNMYEKLLEQ